MCILKILTAFWLHSKYSGPFLIVAGPNVFIMLKTFEVHSKWENIERHSKCILTVLWLYSKYFYGMLRHSNCIRSNILIAFEGKSKRQATSNPARMSRMHLEWVGMHLKCISIAAGINFDIKRIQVECNSNVAGIFRLPLECESNAVPRERQPIGPRMSPDVSQNTTESHIQEYKEFPFRRHSGSFRLYSVTGV